jgi:hypothetical protein
MYIDGIDAGDSYIDSSAEAVVDVERQGCLPNSHCAGAAGGEQGIRRAAATALARAPTPMTPSFTTKTKQIKQPRRFFAASGVEHAQHTQDQLRRKQDSKDQFRFRRPVFHYRLKCKVANILAQATALRTNLDIDGAPISRAYANTSNSQKSRLLFIASSEFTVFDCIMYTILSRVSPDSPDRIF